MAEWDCSARGKRLCCYFPPWVATTLIIHECSLWSHVTCTEITFMCLWFTFSAIHTFRFIRPIIRNPAIKTLATNIYYHVNFCNVQSEMKSLQRHLGQMSLCRLPATIGVVTLLQMKVNTSERWALEQLSTCRICRIFLFVIDSIVCLWLLWLLDLSLIGRIGQSTGLEQDTVGNVLRLETNDYDNVIGDGIQLEHHDNGSHHNGDSSSDVVLTSSNSQQPPSAADSLSSHHHLPAASDFGAVSLDDAWKTFSSSVVLTNGKHQKRVSDARYITLWVCNRRWISACNKPEDVSTYKNAVTHAPRQQCLHDLWPWLLTFSLQNKWVSREHLYVKFGDRSCSDFWDIVRMTIFSHKHFTR